MAARAEHLGSAGTDTNAEVLDGLSNLAVEDLQHIVDGVYQERLSAPREEVLRALYAFRRIRELPAAVVEHLADCIARGEHRLWRRAV